MHPGIALAVALTVASAAPEEWVAFPDEATGLVTASPSLGKAGRNFARARVVATVLDAAAALHGVNGVNGESFIVIADVGRKGGGKMPPHATHRDGRTLDILMPVIDASGHLQHFPHADEDGFGYCARFDVDGRFVGTGWEGKHPVPHPSGKGLLCKESNQMLQLAIDFGFVARMVAALEASAVSRGLRVSRVIVAPEYVDRVLATDPGKLLDKRLVSTFVRKPVWTRHDDHVHIEFEALRK